MECPVDNPAPLTRLGDAIPVTEKNMDLMEIPSEYFMEKEGTLLFQVGKIERSCEGCDGPMSKVTRDFILRGDRATLIDVEAGIEHFGRGVEQNVDIIIVVADPTFESLLIAGKVALLCGQMEKEKVWTVLNKVQSEEMEAIMLDELKKKKVETLGVVHFDAELVKSGLMGTQLRKSHAKEDLQIIITKLEEAI